MTLSALFAGDAGLDPVLRISLVTTPRDEEALQ